MGRLASIHHVRASCGEAGNFGQGPRIHVWVIAKTEGRHDGGLACSLCSFSIKVSTGLFRPLVAGFENNSGLIWSPLTVGLYSGVSSIRGACQCAPYCRPVSVCFHFMHSMRISVAARTWMPSIAWPFTSASISEAASDGGLFRFSMAGGGMCMVLACFDPRGLG